MLPAEGSAAIPTTERAQRIVVIGAGTAEVAIALGMAPRIVATDTSARVYDELSHSVDLGSPHRLAAESVIAQRPDLVVAAAAGPQSDTLEGQLASASVPYVQLGELTTVDGVFDRIARIGEILQAVPQAEELANNLRGELAEAERIANADPATPSALFLYARGHGTLFVAGSNTLADDVLRRAGATNAAASLDGFQALTPEALVVGQPQWFVIPAKGLDSVGGVEGLLAVPGVSETPAGMARNFLSIEDHRVLGGGPSIGGAIRDLATAFAAPNPGAPSP